MSYFKTWNTCHTVWYVETPFQHSTTTCLTPADVQARTNKVVASGDGCWCLSSINICASNSRTSYLSVFLSGLIFHDTLKYFSTSSSGYTLRFDVVIPN